MRCRKCGTEFTADKMLTNCPNCEHLGVLGQFALKDDIFEGSRNAFDALEELQKRRAQRAKELAVVSDPRRFQRNCQDLDFDGDASELNFYPAVESLIIPSILTLLGMAFVCFVAGHAVAFGLFGGKGDAPAPASVNWGFTIFFYLISIPLIYCFWRSSGTLRWYCFSLPKGTLAINVGFQKIVIPLGQIGSVNIGNSFSMAIDNSPRPPIYRFVYPLFLNLKEGDIVSISTNNNMIWTEEAGKAIARLLDIPFEKSTRLLF